MLLLQNARQSRFWSDAITPVQGPIPNGKPQLETVKK